MKYLVTGATGLLGNNIVRDLLAAGHAVRVLARGGDLRPLAGLAVETAAGDVRDAAAVHQACDGIEVVIHSAGHVHIGWTGLELARQINVAGTRNIAAAARAAGARLVHVSSVNALGLGPLAEPAGEDSARPGILEIPYVVTKREAEQAVLDEVGRGLWAAIVNPGTMFGPWDWKPSSGQMLLEVTKFALWAPVGAGCFCDVRDVSAGAIAAASRGQPGRRYILGGHNLSFRDAWRQIAALSGQAWPAPADGPGLSGNCDADRQPEELAFAAGRGGELGGDRHVATVALLYERPGRARVGLPHSAARRDPGRRLAMVRRARVPTVTQVGGFR